MSLPDDYEIITTTSTDASVKVYVPWTFDGVDELNVWYQNTISGVVYYLSNADFTVTTDSDGGGVFILIENTQGAEAIDISIARETPKTQTYSLNEAEALNPTSLIEALDKAIKLLQEVALGYDEQNITSINPFAIPDKVTRAGKIQAFDENGDPTYATVGEALQDPVDWATEWAKKAEDVLISLSAGGNGTTDYSSLHHAAKSAASAAAAVISASDASTAKDDAETAQTAAELAETNAETAQTAAELAQTNSETAQTAAELAQTNAETARDKASDWAEEAEDVPVETGPDQFSAMHWAIKAAAAGVAKFAIYEDQKASGVAGGSSVSGFQTRTLNTEVSDIHNIGTLSANAVTLIAGTYLVEATATAFASGAHQATLNDGTSDILSGLSMRVQSSVNVSNSSKVIGVIVADGVKAYSVRHRTGTANAGDGLGYAAGAGLSEVYTQLKFTKIG